ncbi:MAG TPA: TonB-dependent receptor [Sphingomonas sp.]|nr:TonB-dependent receptor [Sphingomonas sp.]
MLSTTKNILLMASASLIAVMGANLAHAAQQSYRIPAQDLGSALQEFTRISGARVVAASDLVAGRQSRAVEDVLSASDALSAILAGSGLHAELIAGAYVLRPDGKGGAAKAPVVASMDIVVTGSRIHGSGPIGSPLTVIDRKTIEDSGRATVADYVQTLPQNFGGGPNEGLTGTTARNGANSNVNYGASINLRGLGTASTLVLFDGNRPALGGAYGAFTDISLIPSVAIERIEILTDGASAIYGTDAVAGVVNVRFRDHFKGFETHLYSGTADGAFGQLQLAQAAGTRWSGGGIMLAYQFDHRGGLAGADRRASTEDLRPWGGPDQRSVYADPGNILAANGESFAIGRSTAPGHPTLADLVPGETNLVDNQKRVDLLPRQQTHSLYLAADQEILPGLSVFARGLYSRRHFDLEVLPFEGQVLIAPGSPWYLDPIGTGEPILLERDFRTEVGDPRSAGTTQGLSLTGGFEGRLGSWHVELSGDYGRQTENNRLSNVVNFNHVADLVVDPASGFDPYGGNSPALIARIRSSVRDHSLYQVGSATLRADGTLFELPAGAVKLAVGGEYRHESLVSRTTDNVYAEQPEVTDIYGTPAARHIEAAYAELLVPIFAAPDRLPGRLDLSLAGRMEWYSDVGRTQNPKVGLSWRPVVGLTLRSSYGTSFRAPGFTENIGASFNLYQPFYVPDPASPTGQSAVLGLFGSAAHIGPEKARTWTAGFDIAPPRLAGLRLSATYFDIAYRDRIGSAATDAFSYLLFRNIYGGLIQDHPDAATLAAYYASPGFQNPDGIPPSAIVAILDGLTRNLSSVTVRGIDFDLSYTQPMLGGQVSVGADGTRLLTIAQRLTTGSPATDVVSTFGNPVKLRLRGHAGWSRGGFEAHVTVNHVGSYSNNAIVPAEHVGAWTTIDAQIGYSFPRPTPFGRARLALSALNLFDKAPPYINNTAFNSTLAYDPGQASAIGRVVALEASFSW